MKPTRLALAAILLALARGAGRCQEAASPPSRALAQAQARLRRQMESMTPLLDQLKNLTGQYGDTSRLEELSKQSKTLRAEADKRLHELDDLTEDFNRLKREDQFQKTSIAVRRIFQERKLHAFEKDLQLAFEQNEFKRTVDNFKTEFQVALNQEDESRRAAQRALEMKRYLIWAGSVGTALLIGLFLLFLKLRRREALEVVGESVPLEGPSGRLTPQPTPAGAGEALSPGAVLGGSFKIVRELGKGSMGPVYEALDLGRQKPIVIKRIREELHRSEKDLERFLSEARAVAALKHRNLAEIHSVFLDRDRICLAMEFVWGRSLARFLDSGNRISVRSIKTVFSQVAGVLDHAHAQRVVHGDLKPSNIMVTPEGVVKVMDFSLALTAKKTVARLSWAEAGGSPAYMAPEQELGTAGPESDIYSLGIIFYEMVTGRLPFEGPNFLAQKKEMRYRPPTKAVPGLPKEVDLIVHTALQPDPKFRFATAKEMYAMISALPDGEAPATTPQKTA